MSIESLTDPAAVRSRARKTPTFIECAERYLAEEVGVTGSVPARRPPGRLCVVSGCRDTRLMTAWYGSTLI
jgi:hypothetical protein